MSSQRGKPSGELSAALASKLRTLYGPCIECDECHGLCPPLIEALMLPDAVLKPRDRDAEGE